MHTDIHRRTQMNPDEHKANCVRCVGRHNLKMRPDVRHLFKDLGTYYTFFFFDPYLRLKLLFLQLNVNVRQWQENTTVGGSSSVQSTPKGA